MRMELYNKFMKLLHIGQYLNNFQKDIIYQNRKDRLTELALCSSTKGISKERYCQKEVIVSLTTYGKRLYDVYLAIESIMQQSMKPNRIVLWLGDELKNRPLPRILGFQQQRGLEIVFCKDIYSYTKLIPALRKFPNDIIITVDDDLIYNVDMVERLVGAYIDDPSYIYCCRMHKMRLKKNGLLEGYMAWDWETSLLDASPLNFPTGCGGVLYPPHCFNDEVFNENVFLNICKFADHVWFKAMSLYNGVQSKRIVTRNSKGKEYIENMEVQDVGLYHINNNKTVNRNDIQLKAVFDKYNLYALLKK